MLHKTSRTTFLTFCNRGVSRFRQPASSLFLTALLSVNSSFLLNARQNQPFPSTTTLTIKIVKDTGLGSYATVSGSVNPTSYGGPSTVSFTSSAFGSLGQLTFTGTGYSMVFSGNVFLPALWNSGSYTVTAHYGGYGIMVLPSNSAPVTVKPPHYVPVYTGPGIT